MRTAIVALLSIALSVTAQFSLKAGMASEGVRRALAEPHSLQTLLTVLTDKFVFGGFMLYGLGAVIWLDVLSRWDVSKAYPLVGLGFVLTLGVGLALGEQVNAQRFAGVALICAGVFLVGRS
ncbi:membrane protein [Azoarcus olearius]|uniref:Small Multi-Drug resistant family protein n=1 Tax=Azoarcus sp. (strain BH72) TaxID=418699 RepID=A1K2B1_AZOSB|nr:membrane protein [Azoarcus olearius]CAL92966.1 putative Small Multi-Drug resistant family protein [Azoarcus olearius]